MEIPNFMFPSTMESPSFSSTPTMEIPSSKTELKTLLKKHSDHRGLLSAYKSLKIKRHPNTATILLVGLSGAGKSSTVNSLFGKRLADTGNSASCSSKIAEYEIEVPIEFPPNSVGETDKITNTRLRIIDTPGFGDTRSTDLDAQLIATLKKYFKGHSELKERFPNIVLICERFDDNRFSGESSNFVKMLKGLDSLKEHIFDLNNPNVILCLTHYLSITKRSIKQNPTSRCDDFATQIQLFTSLKARVKTVLVENECEEHERPKNNGYYKLPNQEYFPFSLYEAMKEIGTKNCDRIGRQILYHAFKNIELFQPKMIKEIDLVPPTDRDTVRASKIITQIHFHLTDSPVQRSLEDAWNNLDQSKKDLYPLTVLNVQRLFQRNNISSFQDIPKDKLQILKLIGQIQPSPLLPDLLASSIGLQLPKLQIRLSAGQCYNIINFEENPNTIFDITEEYALSPVGYLIPNYLDFVYENETSDICEFYSSTEEFINRRLKAFGIDGNISINAFGANVATSFSYGHNILERSSKGIQISKFTSIREHRLFRLTVNDKAKLGNDFKEAVKNLPKKFTQENISTVEDYKGFFYRYGTHIVTSALGGGAIELAASSPNTTVLDSNSDLVKFGFAIQANLMRKFNLDMNMTEIDLSLEKKLNEWTYSAYLKGGDMKFHSANLATQTPEEAKSTREKWLATVIGDPVMLTTNLKLVPISEFAKQVDADISQEINLAVKELFQANLKYVPPSQASPPPERKQISNPEQVRKQITNPEQVKSGSCLKAGTEILMVDGSKKLVENICRGDQLLDRELQPCTVIGANYVFLGERAFYGFEKDCCFFTNDHIFLGDDQYYVASEQMLLENNPFLASLKAREVEPGETIPVLKMCEKSRSVKCEMMTLRKEEPGVSYSDTRVYYIIVSSPSGTYIANNIVCRHELPSLFGTPKTTACLQRILNSPGLVEFVENKKLTPSAMFDIDFIAEKILRGLKSGDFMRENKQNFSTNKIDVNFLNEIEKILDNSYWAAFAMRLYGKCGTSLVKLLEVENADVDVVSNFAILTILECLKNCFSE